MTPELEAACEAFVQHARLYGFVYIEDHWRDNPSNVLIDGDFDFGGAVAAAIDAYKRGA